MVTYSVNYLAVVVAAIVNMVIGYIWYSPMVFGKAWMGMMGKGGKDAYGAKKKSNMPMVFGVGYVATVVMAYVLAIFIRYTGASTPLTGAMTAFWAWLGFVATVTLGGVLWEGKPVQLYVLNAAHHLVGMLAMGAVLAAWPY